MPTKKISELTELASAAGTDKFPVVDTSAGETKFIQTTNLPSGGGGGPSNDSTFEQYWNYSNTGTTARYWGMNSGGLEIGSVDWRTLVGVAQDCEFENATTIFSASGTDGLVYRVNLYVNGSFVAGATATVGSVGSFYGATFSLGSSFVASAGDYVSWRLSGSASESTALPAAISNGNLTVQGKYT